MEVGDKRRRLPNVNHARVIRFSNAQECRSQHIGNTKFLETKAGFNFNDGLISFGAKRNLLTNSAEFYDLSYEYINDCLKAGVAFRREFYKDRDLEPEDSLIFKITFSPLGTISTPSF